MGEQMGDKKGLIEVTVFEQGPDREKDMLFSLEEGVEAGLIEEHEHQER